MVDQLCAQRGLCNSFGIEGCAAMEEFDRGNTRDPVKFVAVANRCEDHNLSGGADGKQEAGTVCFLNDIAGLEISPDPVMELQEDGTAVVVEIASEPQYADLIYRPGNDRNYIDPGEELYA